MKPRKPTTKEEKFLRNLGFDPKYFLTLGKDFESYTFVEVSSGKTFSIRR